MYLNTKYINCLQIQSYIHTYRQLLLLLYTWLKAVFSRYEDVLLDRKTRDHLAWTTGNGDPMYRVCIPHSIPCSWEKQG